MEPDFQINPPVRLIAVEILEDDLARAQASEETGETKDVLRSAFGTTILLEYWGSAA